MVGLANSIIHVCPACTGTSVSMGDDALAPEYQATPSDVFETFELHRAHHRLIGETVSCMPGGGTAGDEFIYEEC